jgi:hypothetical protein
MKKVFSLLLLFCLASAMVMAQSSLPGLDKSPMDMSYCPANYPGLLAQGKPTDPLTARVIYSRPQKNGRKIFGGLVEYGKVWRLGANESTEIDFFTTVSIDGKKVAPGRYTIYCIPDSANNKWTIILNTATDTWGAYSYDQSKDVLRTDVPVQKQPTSTEALVMAFEKTPTGSNLIIVWDEVKCALPISF